MIFSGSNLNPRARFLLRSGAKCPSRVTLTVCESMLSIPIFFSFF